jgi:lysozyme
MNADARERLRLQLVIDEDLKTSAYQDSLGFWTIGIGRLIDARKGGGITTAEAFYLADNDIDLRVHGLVNGYRWFVELDPVRQAVLVNMAFNLGLGGLAEFRRMLAAIARHDYDLAAAEMMASTWATQVGMRALRLAQQMRSGKW